MGQRKGRQGKKRACNPTACECGQAFNCVAAIEKFFNDACRQGRAGEHTEWQGAQPGQLNLETGKGKHPDEPQAKRRGTRPHSQGDDTATAGDPAIAKSKPTAPAVRVIRRARLRVPNV